MKNLLTLTMILSMASASVFAVKNPQTIFSSPEAFNITLQDTRGNLISDVDFPARSAYTFNPANREDGTYTLNVTFQGNAQKAKKIQVFVSEDLPSGFVTVSHLNDDAIKGIEISFYDMRPDDIPEMTVNNGAFIIPVEGKASVQIFCADPNFTLKSCGNTIKLKKDAEGNFMPQSEVQDANHDDDNDAEQLDDETLAALAAIDAAYDDPKSATAAVQMQIEELIAAQKAEQSNVQPAAPAAPAAPVAPAPVVQPQNDAAAQRAQRAAAAEARAKAAAVAAKNQQK